MRRRTLTVQVPAAPKINAPVQTDAVHSVVPWTFRSQSSTPSSTICPGVVEPPHRDRGSPDDRGRALERPPDNFQGLD
jgi:hypothetical protein